MQLTTRYFTENFDFYLSTAQIITKRLKCRSYFLLRSDLRLLTDLCTKACLAGHFTTASLLCDFFSVSIHCKTYKTEGWILMIILILKWQDQKCYFLGILLGVSLMQRIFLNLEDIIVKTRDAFLVFEVICHVYEIFISYQISISISLLRILPKSRMKNFNK